MSSITLKSGRTWYESEISQSKNSKFQGHFTKLNSVNDEENIQNYINELIQNNKSISKSSHPSMFAWIKRSEQGIVNQGISDCGESGAGIKLMYVLQKMELVDVLVVVTRWYGGVPMGSSRFRYICNAAMDAIRIGVEDNKEKDENKSRKVHKKKNK